MRKVFTTGQVAKICKVASSTVSRWFDSGRLKGYLIPGSQDRRIPREDLIKFLKEHGMPMGELEDEQRGKILIVSQDQALIGHLKQKIEDTRVLKEEIVHSGFDAGIQAIDFHPDCVVVDLSIGQTEALQIFQNIRRNDVLREAFTIALIPDVGGQRRFDRTDIDETFKKPFDPILLVERMLTVIGKRKKLVLS